MTDTIEASTPFQTPTAVTTGRSMRLRRALMNYAGVGTVLVAMCVYLSVTEDKFLTSETARIILENNALLAITAIGLTFVLLVGGFDLSVGGVFVMSAVLLSVLIKRGVPVGLAMVLVVVGVTLLSLAVNGVLIGKVGLSFLVVTLGTASVYTGAALVWTKGQSKSLATERFLVKLGQGRLGPVPWLVLVAGTFFVLAILVLRYTGYGRMIYAVGGNPEAARLAGINVIAVRMSVWAIAGCFASIAGVLGVARLTTASPTSNSDIALRAGAAVLLGGTSFMGGRGTMFGTLLGTLFLGVLSYGITARGVSAFWQGIVSGAVLVLAALLDRLRHRGAVSA